MESESLKPLGSANAVAVKPRSIMTINARAQVLRKTFIIRKTPSEIAVI